MDRVNTAIGYVGSFRLSADAKERAMNDTAWANGLRGVAAVMVVSSHLVLCYARGLIPPCCAPGSASPSLFQRPVFRLVASGHSWVAIFFILMGFVNALKPIQLARDGQVDKALNKLASSSFGRIFRLVLPATAATVISWFLCNVGLYHKAGLSDAYWLNANTPRPSPTWLQAFVDLLSGLEATWTFGPENVYDQPQWALIFLLQGSFMVISALFLVVSMTPLWRTVALMILAFWSLNWSRAIGDPWTGFCCFIGIVLSELSLSNIPQRVADVSPYLSPPVVLVSLVLMSYPSSFHESAPWSLWLHDMGIRFFPKATADAMDRMYGSLGGILLVLGILISPHARWALSRSVPTWLGKVSFAIYLIHGTMLRTVFAWVLHLGQGLAVFGEFLEDGSEYRFERYPVPGFWKCAFATVVMAVCTCAASQLWNMKLEPLFAKITTKLEGLVSGRFSIEVKATEKSILPTRKD